ncbi:VirB4 family type IV secretion system protein [Chitinimonas koreensis]|uniref:VirB4 family type IV secretion system protein n=1 Tax=Chitinimonas koreensis TaxID=356302 RepID=UPI0016541C89|nr:hypothetical protein [Chitinimonas koreensis]QNM95530.1 hypothetical protein H9L41_16890 [Chitinimonas koreensis]
MLNLRDQRFRYDHVGDDERRSTAELAPWLFAYDDKLIVNKDSGLLACYAIGGIDAEALMNGEVNQWAQQLQGVLNGLKQWPPTLWWTVHRRAESNWPTGQFLNPIAAQLDAHMAARQAAGGKNFVNRHYLSLLGNALANKMGLQDRLTHAIRRSDSLPKALFEAIRTHFFAGSAFAYTAGELDLAVARYEEMLATTTQALPDMQFERLRGDALHAFLHACASIVHAGQARVALPNNVLMDAALGDAVIEPRGDHLVIRGFRTKYTAAIQIKQWPTPPDGARVRKLERLLTLPVELTLSLCWRKLHRDDALRLLKARKYYFDLTKFNPLTYVAAALAKKKDMEGVTPRADKAAAVAEVESIIKEIEEDTIGYGPANLTILVHADSPEKLQDAVDLVENELRSARLLPIRETFHLVSAYAGTLPGQWGEIVRWIEFSSAHIAHLAPVFTVRPGDSINGYLTEQLKRICPALVQFLTEHGTAVNVNFHALDKGHVLVVGPTRGGKTVLINLLLVLFARYGKVRVIRFDRDRSCRIPTLLTGGTWINTRDSETRINPLVLLADKRHWLFLTEWIKQLAGTVGSAFDADDAKSLHEAMEMTAGLPAASWRLWRLQTIWLHLPPGKLKDALARGSKAALTAQSSITPRTTSASPTTSASKWVACWSRPRRPSSSST